MKTSRNVESFNLDHTKVVAPYVRLAGTLIGPKGDVVSKYDIRFTQPNTEYLSNGALHTLEHLVAEYIRDELDGVIDFSPMGCRTGFYVSMFGEHEEATIAESFLRVLTKVAQWDDLKTVPGVDPVMCGNWEEHDLSGAKSWAARWVADIEKKGHKAFPNH